MSKLLLWVRNGYRRLAKRSGTVIEAGLLLALVCTLVAPRVAMAQVLPAERPALVAAAANLQQVLAQLVPLFEKQQGQKVSLTIGSSANLVRQIQQGLPADLFLSADEDFALRLFDGGLAPDRGAVYATGRLVLMVPADSKISLDPQLTGLTAGLPQITKFAIANPELAPYGKAAVQALQKQAVWPALQDKIVLGENIAQTTQFISTGAAQAGITALSLALAPEVAQSGRHIALPASLHAPLRQRMVLLKSATPAALALYAYLQSEGAREIFRRYGFS